LSGKAGGVDTTPKKEEYSHNMKKFIVLVIFILTASIPSTAYAGKTPAPKITKVTPTPTKQSSFKTALTESQMRNCLKTSSSASKCAKG